MIANAHPYSDTSNRDKFRLCCLQACSGPVYFCLILENFVMCCLCRCAGQAGRLGCCCNGMAFGEATPGAADSALVSC